MNLTPMLASAFATAFDAYMVVCVVLVTFQLVCLAAFGLLVRGECRKHRLDTAGRRGKAMYLPAEWSARRD